jgi:hypothetical protein
MVLLFNTGSDPKLSAKVCVHTSKVAAGVSRHQLVGLSRYQLVDISLHQSASAGISLHQPAGISRYQPMLPVSAGISRYQPISRHTSAQPSSVK